MESNPEVETSYITEYQEVILKDVENEYCAKHRHVPVNKPKCVLSSNLASAVQASRSSQSSIDPYDLSSDDEEYSTPNKVAKATPSRSDRPAH